MPKTVTTTLQYCLFAKHSEIEYVSKFHSPVLAKTLHRVSKPNANLPASVIKDLRREMEPHWQAGKPCVFSNESLVRGDANKRRRQAKCVRTALGDCQILITIREPVSFMESHYFQELKAFNLRQGRRPWLVDNFGKSPRYFNINAWCSVLQDDPRTDGFEPLKMAETAEIYAEMFGKENIHLVVFEKLKQNPREFLADICCCVGVSLDEASHLCTGRAKNVRWTEFSIDRLKRLEASFLPKWKYRLRRAFGIRRGRKTLNRQLFANDSMQERESPRARAQLDPKWRAVFEKIGREQSQRIVARWGIPLEDYGYPVPERQRVERPAA
jgi:hypothetical protein